jgi:hypothetical protein
MHLNQSVQSLNNWRNEMIALNQAFVVDWPMPESSARPDAAVEVHYNDQKIGLYRVKHLGNEGMTLAHGVISFPKGTKLVIEDYQMLVPTMRRPLVAEVVQNDSQGIHISW